MLPRHFDLLSWDPMEKGEQKWVMGPHTSIINDIKDKFQSFTNDIKDKFQSSKMGVGQISK